MGLPGVNASGGSSTVLAYVEHEVGALKQQVGQAAAGLKSALHNIVHSESLPELAAKHFAASGEERKAKAARANGDPSVTDQNVADAERATGDALAQLERARSGQGGANVNQMAHSPPMPELPRDLPSRAQNLIGRALAAVEAAKAAGGRGLPDAEAALRHAQRGAGLTSQAGQGLMDGFNIGTPTALIASADKELKKAKQKLDKAAKSTANSFEALTHDTADLVRGKRSVVEYAKDHPVATVLAGGTVVVGGGWLAATYLTAEGLGVASVAGLAGLGIHSAIASDTDGQGNGS